MRYYDYYALSQWNYPSLLLCRQWLNPYGGLQRAVVDRILDSILQVENGIRQNSLALYISGPSGISPSKARARATPGPK